MADGPDADAGGRPDSVAREACDELIGELLGMAHGDSDGGELEGLEDAPPNRRVELLGRALWDVFSSNHTVVGPEGRPCDLGSFRASAGFIADAANRLHLQLDREYGYLDFYMGAALVADRDRLVPVYRGIFERLRERGCDWRYSFPRLHLVRLSSGPASDDDPGQSGYLSYDPGDAVRTELSAGEEERELGSLQEEIERRNTEAVRRARHEPLPPAVAAYREVYGRLPEGWPHPDM